MRRSRAYSTGGSAEGRTKRHTGHPDGIRTLFSASPEGFDAVGAELLGPVLGESNLILLGGERHRAMRKLQMPPFHGERMRAYGRIMVDVALAHAAQWTRNVPIPIHRVRVGVRNTTVGPREEIEMLRA